MAVRLMRDTASVGTDFIVARLLQLSAPARGDAQAGRR